MATNLLQKLHAPRLRSALRALLRGTAIATGVVATGGIGTTGLYMAARSKTATEHVTMPFNDYAARHGAPPGITKEFDVAAARVYTDTSLVGRLHFTAHRPEAQQVQGAGWLAAGFRYVKDYADGLSDDYSFTPSHPIAFRSPHTGTSYIVPPPPDYGIRDMVEGFTGLPAADIAKGHDREKLDRLTRLFVIYHEAAHAQQQQGGGLLPAGRAENQTRAEAEADIRAFVALRNTEEKGPELELLEKTVQDVRIIEAMSKRGTSHFSTYMLRRALYFGDGLPSPAKVREETEQLSALAKFTAADAEILNPVVDAAYGGRPPEGIRLYHAARARLDGGFPYHLLGKEDGEEPDDALYRLAVTFTTAMENLDSLVGGGLLKNDRATVDRTIAALHESDKKAHAAYTAQPPSPPGL